MSQQIVGNFIDDLTAAFARGDREVGRKATEAANVQKVQELYRTLARGDLAAATMALTEDVEFEISVPAEFGFQPRARGREEALAVLQANFAQVENQRPEILELVAQGDLVVVIARERGRHRSTGRDYDVRWVQIFELREGRIARFREFTATGAPPA